MKIVQFWIMNSILKTSHTISKENQKNTVSKNSYSGKDITKIFTNGFFSVDEQWTVKYLNKAAEELLNVRSKDIVGKNLLEKLSAIVPLEFHSVYQKAFINDTPLHFEEHWGEMGSWYDVITYYCDNTLSVSFKSSNHPHYDYPENHEELLKNITELYKLVTEITNDCLWEWNLPEAEIFWIDGGHKRMFGYQVENALIQQSFWESRLHPEDRIRVLKKLNETVAIGKECIWNDDYRFARADGTYAYVHDRGHIICNEGQAYKMIGVTQDITENVLLQKKLDEQSLINQREITSAILTAHENEQMEIGKKLNENINQVLAATNIYIQLAQKNKDINKREIYLEKSTDFIKEIIKEIRSISITMVPPGIGLLGLSENIETLLDDFRSTHHLIIDFHEKGSSVETLDEKFQMNIWRILQEQLKYISKHSKENHTIIKLSGYKNRIVLFISHNGKGFDTTKTINSIGIRNVISRAELYQGTAKFITNPGKGYSLTVTFPININKQSIND